MTKFDEEKKRLLLELKQETLKQLAAVRAEDPEQFLQSTDLCNTYIGSYNALVVHASDSTDTLKDECRKILLDIAGIRDEISNLIPPLYEKLKQKSVAEKKMNFAKSRYMQDDLSLPSVFMDKKI